MSTNDIYISREIRKAATSLGFWLVAAAVIHAILLPVASMIITKMAMRSAAAEMQENMATFKQKMEQISPRK